MFELVQAELQSKEYHGRSQILCRQKCTRAAQLSLPVSLAPAKLFASICIFDLSSCSCFCNQASYCLWRSQARCNLRVTTQTHQQISLAMSCLMMSTTSCHVMPHGCCAIAYAPRQCKLASVDFRLSKYTHTHTHTHTHAHAHTHACTPAVGGIRSLLQVQSQRLYPTSGTAAVLSLPVL